MKRLDLTLPTPAENLALDEALLDAAESATGGEVLRFWESPIHFVVVGYANRVDEEVNRTRCAELGIPILRRCSGGGTVVQGPGSLNYSLVLPIAAHPELATIPQTNCFVMGRLKAALREILGQAVEVQGHTDLVLGVRKFSGNAQRRRRDFLLFHGTFLLQFDIDLIEQLLPLPSREPDYRARRSHRAFLTNLGTPPEVLKGTLQKHWGTRGEVQEIPPLDSLLREKYENRLWNDKW